MRLSRSVEASSDDGGVWLNLAKLLIPLAFICVWIFVQLGLNPFTHPYIIIYPNEAKASANSGASMQQVWFTNPIFSITFLPLAITQPYEKVQVGILEVWCGCIQTQT